MSATMGLGESLSGSLFGAPLEDRGPHCIETVSSTVALLYSVAPGTSPLAPTEPRPGLAGVVPVTGDAVGCTLTYAAPLAVMQPLPRTHADRPAVIRSLAAAAHAVAALHGEGRVHGGLRPESILLAPDGLTRVLVSAGPVDTLALLVATVRSDVPGVQAVAFAAPELIAGQTPTAASDVYAMAATAFHALTGSLPVGQINLARMLSGLPALHASVLAAGLRAAPDTRPTMDSLATALDACAAGAPSPTVEQPAQRAELSAILVLVLLVGGFFVLSGAIWLVAVGWDQLGETGRLALLGVLTAGVWAAGEASLANKYPRTGLALVTLATQLVWANAAYVLSMYHLRGAGPWTVISGIVSAITLLFALRFRASTLAVAATIDLVITAGWLAAYLHTGNPLGPVTFSAATGAAFALLATVCHRLAGRPVGVPLALASVCAMALSGCAGLVLLADGHRTLVGTVWPYTIALTLAVPALLGARSPYAAIGLTVCILALACTPTAEALIRSDSLAYLAAAVVAGSVTAVAAVFSPARLRAHFDETLACISGAAGMVLAPGLRALRHLDGPEEANSVGIALGVSVIALVVAFGLSERATRKDSYRLVEGAGLGLFFGVLTVGSVVHLSSYTYPALLLGGGFTALAVGTWGRRAVLVAFSAAALSLNVWIQYFGKLRDVLPVSLLMVGFGLAVLASGFAFERKVREFLPRLKEWA